MPELKKCRACGVEIRSNAPFGHCPQCLIALGFGPVPEKPAEAPKNTSVQHSFGTVRYFGDYELLEEIARGGMGTVFRARQTSLNRLVALKLISAGALATEELVKRFKAEAESAASLTHPNIVPIHEIGQHEGQHYFSMGLIEGGSLAEKLRKLHRPHPKPGSRQGDEADGTVARTGPPPHVGGYAPLSLRDSAQLLITIARAVHYAHQRGVLHRDLKPGNILLDDKGQPHLTDFGLAKLIEKESALTHTNAVMGTPAYMSPEQARGESKDVTTATDVYGLGAVFYETLTGSPPFGGGTSMETIRQVIDQEPRRPSILNPKVDRDLETICLKCLEKEPQRRYTSAEAFADDLERWLRDEPILARRATLFERATKWARRQPVLAAAVVLLHVVLLLGIGGVFWQWRRADHASRETSQSNDQLRRALDQMDYIQLQRAEEYFAEDRRADALPRWALVLRNNPSNRLAAERLMSTLSHRNWARLACPPLEHSNRVTFALFSRDGTKVVTSSADNTAWVWDAVTGRRLAGPFTHGAEINTAMLSEDGRFVVTASKDKTARVWNALTGAFVTEPLQHSGDVSMAGFSADGEKVFTVCGDTGQLWSVNNGQRMGDAIRGAGSITDVRLSPDGSRLAMACIGRRAQLWDVASGACLHHLQHANDILSVAFSPDGKQLVTASYDNTARVWDVQTGEPASEPLRHQARVWLAEFSPDGQRIVTASGDHTAQIWDARTGKKIGPPMKHDGEVRCALFSPEGTRVVTASWDKTVRVWDALTGESLTEPLAHDDRMFFAGFFPDGERILTAGNGNVVHIWNVAALKGSALTSPHVYPYMTEFSPDGKTIIVRSHTGHSQLLDPFTLAKKGELRPHESGAHRFDFSPDGTLIATASLDRGARVWNTRTGEEVTPELKHDRAVEGAWFSPDGKKLATVSADKTVGVWNATNGQPVIPPIRCKAHPRWVNFGRDSHRIVVVADAPEAGVWDIQTGQRLFALQHRDTVNWAEFSPDGTQIVTASADMTAQLWNAKTGERNGSGFLHPLVVTRAYFSPDGGRLLTKTHGESGAWLWDTHTRRRLAEPNHREESISAIAFSPDGSRFATAGGRNAWLWDAWTGQRLSENLARLDAPLRSGNTLAKFSPDGRLIAIATDGQYLRVWEAPSAPLPVPTWLPELAEGLAGQRFNQQGQLEPVRPAELWAAQQRMAAWAEAQGSERGRSPARSALEATRGSETSRAVTRSEAAADGDRPRSDVFYARWAKWFLADASTRTVLPSSPLTLPEYAVQLSNQGTVESAAAALRLQPANGLIMARLAQALVENKQTNTFAEWFSLRATELAPGHAVTWWTRSYVLTAMGRRVEAMELMPRVEALVPNNPKFYNDKGYMMEQAGQWENAIVAYTKSISLTTFPTNGFRQLRRDAFEGRRRILTLLGRNSEAYHDLLCEGWIPPRATNSSNALIDLTRFYNESFVERAIERGLSGPLFVGQHTLAGSAFDLRGIVQLAGSEEQADDGNFPEKVTGIPINQSVRLLHFLHSTKGTMPDGVRVGHYAIHYADGEERIVPIVYGEHLRSFTVSIDNARQLKAATEVWTHPDQDPLQNMRLSKHTWPNPRPAVEISTVDFISAKTRCAPFLVAITAEP